MREKNRKCYVTENRRDFAGILPEVDHLPEVKIPTLTSYKLVN